MVIFLAVSGYANYDAFEYTDAPTVYEQAQVILESRVSGIYQCTVDARNSALVSQAGGGGAASRIAQSFAGLDIDAFFDGVFYGQALPDDDDNAAVDDVVVDDAVVDDVVVDDAAVDGTDDAVDDGGLGGLIPELLNQLTVSLTEYCLFDATDVSDDKVFVRAA